MGRSVVVLVLLLLAACGEDDNDWCPESHDECFPDGPTEIDFCDPVAQTGCGTGEKCTWLHLDQGSGLATLACVQDQLVPNGGACAYGPDGESSGYDDCVAGTLCVDGTCRAMCTASPDSCDAPTTCTIHEGVLPPDSGYGVCDP